MAFMFGFLGIVFLAVCSQTVYSAWIKWRYREIIAKDVKLGDLLYVVKVSDPLLKPAPGSLLYCYRAVDDQLLLISRASGVVFCVNKANVDIKFRKCTKTL